MRIRHFRHVTLSKLEGEIFFEFNKSMCKIGYIISRNKKNLSFYSIWGSLASFPTEFLKDLKNKIITAYKDKKDLYVTFHGLCLNYKKTY